MESSIKDQEEKTKILNLFFASEKNQNRSKIIYT